MGLLDALGSDDGMLGLYLMAAGAAKPQRTSLGEGLLGGMQLMQQQRDKRDAKTIAEEERKQKALLQELQRKLLGAQITETEAKAREQARVLGLLGAATAGSSPQLAPSPEGAGPRPGASMQRPAVDPRQLIAQGVPAELVQKYMESPDWGRPTVSGSMSVATPSGGPGTQLYSKHGAPIGGIAPQAVEMKLANLGNVQQPYNPYQLDPTKPLPMGMSPHDREQLGISRGNLNINRERLNFEKNKPTEDNSPLVQILDPVTKVPVWARRKDAVGQTPAGAGTAQETKAAGKSDLDREVTRLAEVYKALDKAKGITNTDRGSWDNVWASAATSGLGQVAGRTFGTVPQSNRDVVNMSRPLLMMAVMKASGMSSAKQIDSNRELSLWLDTASDPSKGFQANMEALNNIATKYGSGPIMDSKFTPGENVLDKADAILGIGKEP